YVDGGRTASEEKKWSVPWYNLNAILVTAGFFFPHDTSPPPPFGIGQHDAGGGYLLYKE
ncbi:hypothetical protein COCCADRAFT_113842, partial [Bipolaris zeicola 26-R-13]